MTIDFKNIKDCHRVNKPWGHELWLQPGSDVYPYALKQLKLETGSMTSLQVHQYKSESILILDGQGQLLYWPEFFDCAQYLNNGYTAEDIVRIKNQLVTVPIGPGAVFHTPPGTIHRMIAHRDLIYIEASTTELDDVVRLEDSSNRPHGRIDSEHA